MASANLLLGKLYNYRRLWSNNLLSSYGARMMTTTAAASPWLMLPPASGGGGSSMSYNFYSLAENKVMSFNKRSLGKQELGLLSLKLVGSSHGWLALFDESNGNLCLVNPLSGRHVDLPSIHTLLMSEGKFGTWCCEKKLIISTSPDDQDCRAVMTYGINYRLAFCVPGLSTEWTPMGAGDSYHDFVYSTREEKFFCITMLAGLEAWDLRDHQSPQMATLDYPDSDRLRGDSFLKGECLPKHSLVVDSGGEILLVRRHIFETTTLVDPGLLRPDGSYIDEDAMFWRDGSFNEQYLKDELQRRVDIELEFDIRNYDKCTHKTIGFDVFKYDRKKKRLRYVKKRHCLDGAVLFLGLNHSSALVARDFPQLKPNSIYFTDTFETPYPEKDHHGGHDIGIFNHEDATFSSCYYPCDIRKIKKIAPPPVWFFPSP